MSNTHVKNIQIEHTAKKFQASTWWTLTPLDSELHRLYPGNAKPLHKTMLTYCYLNYQEQTLVKFESWYRDFPKNASGNVFWEWWPPFCSFFVNSVWPIDTLCDIDPGQYWLRWWLDAWRHQAITWTNVDFSLVRFCGIHLRAISQ